MTKLVNVRLGDALDIRDGTHETPKYVDHGVPLITSKNLTEQGVCFREVSFISEKDHEEISRRSAVSRGDILYGMIGTIGKPTLVETDAKFSIKNVALFKSSNTEIDSQYLLYLLRSDEISRQISQASKGGTQKFVSLGSLRNLRASFPSVSDQRRIAAILDRANTLRTKRREAIVKLDQLLQSVFLEMFGDPVVNPKGWPKLPLHMVCKNEDARRKPIKQADRDERDGPYPYYGASGIIDKFDDYLFDGERLLIAEDGANLVTRSTPIAFMARGKYWVNNHAHVIAESDESDLRFIEKTLELMDLKPYITGSAQPKLNQSNLERIPISSPPLTLQKTFREICERLETEHQRLVSQALTMDVFFESLQQQAFSGDL